MDLPLDLCWPVCRWRDSSAASHGRGHVHWDMFACIVAAPSGSKCIDVYAMVTSWDILLAFSMQLFLAFLFIVSTEQHGMLGSLGPYCPGRGNRQELDFYCHMQACVAIMIILMHLLY